MKSQNLYYEYTKIFTITSELVHLLKKEMLWVILKQEVKHGTRMLNCSKCQLAKLLTLKIQIWDHSLDSSKINLKVLEAFKV